jgi:6,7-dimethyl-8-ribityllumazine synthase
MQTRQRAAQSQPTDGTFDAKGLKIALVVSRFNGDITSSLLQGAQGCLERQGCPARSVDVVRVPGAWELPIAVKRLAAGGKFDAIVALGAVIRGETPHFDVLVRAVPQELARLQLEFDLPVILGLLTTDTLAQASERSGPGTDNKGWEAALVAIEMVELLREIG